MKRPRITCQKCGMIIPLYSKHAKCDPTNKEFNKVHSVSQNRWIWQCKKCQWNGRNYHKHNCKDYFQSHNESQKKDDQNQLTGTKISSLIQDIYNQMSQQNECYSQNDHFLSNISEHKRDENIFFEKDQQVFFQEQFWGKMHDEEIIDQKLLQKQKDKKQKEDAQNEMRKKANQKAESILYKLKHPVQSLQIQQRVCSQCGWKGINLFSHKCVQNRSKEEKSFLFGRILNTQREIITQSIGLKNRTIISLEQAFEKRFSYDNAVRKNIEEQSRQERIKRLWDFNINDPNFQSFMTQVDADLKTVQKGKQQSNFGQKYIKLTKISFIPSKTAVIQATLTNKIEFITLATLLRLITTCQLGEQSIVVNWVGKITHFSFSKFFQRLQIRYPWMKKFKMNVFQVLKGYTNMVNDDIAKIKDMSFIVTRLRDIIEWHIWQPDYLEHTSYYLSQPWTRKNTGHTGLVRRRRKDPKTFQIRRKIARRKHRLIKRAAHVRNDFRKKGLNVLTAAKYDHLTVLVNLKDKKYQHQQILSKVPPKGHAAKYQILKRNVLKERSFDRIVDYLVVSELLNMYTRAKPPQDDIKKDNEGKHVYRYNANNLKSKMALDQIFKPQMKALAETIPISQSTVKKQLNNLFDLYRKSICTEYPYEQSLKYNNLADFAAAVIDCLQKRNLLALRDQFQWMTHDQILSKLGSINQMKQLPEPTQDLMNPNIMVKLTLATVSKYKLCWHCKKWITSGKVFKCAQCQTIYHSNGQCNPLPFCHPCKNELPEQSSVTYEWPLKFFTQRLTTFLQKPKTLPDQTDKSIYQYVRGDILRIKGKYTMSNRSRRDFVFFASYNKSIKKLAIKDENLLEDFHDQVYLPPVIVRQIKGMGLGVLASRDIQQNQFICFYAGDIVNQAFANKNGSVEYAFQYCQGPTMDTTFIIDPIDNWSIGPLLNHSDQPNCRSLKVMTKRGIQIFLISNKNILKGQQLLYDYNLGKNGDYPTKGFK